MIDVRARLSGGAHVNAPHMQRKINHRLRSERMKWGLTQKELAPLLFIRHATQLCRIERGLRDPSVASVFASCLVFGQSLDQLFPGFKGRIQDEVGRQAHKLFVRVEKDKSPQGQKKRELLQSIASRQFGSCP